MLIDVKRRETYDVYGQKGLDAGLEVRFSQTFSHSNALETLASTNQLMQLSKTRSALNFAEAVIARPRYVGIVGGQHLVPPVRPTYLQRISSVVT